MLFRRTNIEMLRLCGATWYEPGPFEDALKDARRETLSNCCRRARRSRNLERFWRGIPADRRRAWGWKDPRTTLTLPLWLEQFPDAAVIHVTRNGVDVAESLIQRERPSYRRWRMIARSLAYPVLSFRWQEYKPRAFAHHRQAFELWAAYVRSGLAATASLSSRQSHWLRYEDLLDQPARELGRITRFLEIAKSEQVIKHLSDGIDARRRNPFLQSPRLRNIYEHVRGDPHMAALGYDAVDSPATPSQPRAQDAAQIHAA